MLRKMETYHSKESTECFHLQHPTIKQLYMSVPTHTLSESLLTSASMEKISEGGWRMRRRNKP